MVNKECDNALSPDRNEDLFKAMVVYRNLSPILQESEG